MAGVQTGPEQKNKGEENPSRAVHEQTCMFSTSYNDLRLMPLWQEVLCSQICVSTKECLKCSIREYTLCVSDRKEGRF